MGKFTRIPEDAFKKLQLNAGVLLDSFDPTTATVADTAILGATSGGINFTATPTFTDMGDDIDNCPKNMKELKKLETWEVRLSGTFVTVDASAVKRLVAAADVSENTVTPRNNLTNEDFVDIWWVGDYSDNTSAESGGFIAINMKNALSTGGFQIQTTDKAKGQFAFEFTGHYSIEDQDTVPFSVYVKTGNT